MSSKRPNFLICLADDLGYSDIGCYGSEINTPNLDKLAAEGMRFSDYHVASLCSPTRSMIMSGTDAHLAGLGVMTEFSMHDRERWNKPGHEGYLNHDVAALPELLRDAGYLTLMTGKWHLGYRKGLLPGDRGFKKSWALLNGCSNHFAYEPVWEGGEKGRSLAAGNHPWLYVKDDHKVMPTPNTANSKDGWYSSDYFADTMVDYLKERTQEEKNFPFFGYLAFSAPHWPLQALPEDRDLHKGKYDDGPDALRLRRAQRLVDLGLVPEHTKPHPVVAPKYPEWDSMTAHEKKMSSRSMEVFAGMVTGIDRAVGKVVKYLEETGELDNTIVMFMSDNGSEGAALEAGPITGRNMLETIDKYYDNSYENLGLHNSFCWYGPRWAQAATAPMRLAKRHTTEGGIRVPLVMRFPKFTQYAPGSICHSFSTCMDIMPTFLELAKTTHPNANPKTRTSKAPYRGTMVYPMRGKSWCPYLTRSATKKTLEDEQLAIHTAEDQPVGWESNGCAGLRYGKWKIVNMPATDRDCGTGDWELFDLDKDQGETNNLASQMPEKLKEMLGYWDEYVAETGTVWGPLVEWDDGTNTMPNWDPDYKPPDQYKYIGGDFIEDMKAWMRLGVGQTWTDLKDVQPEP